jgi:hypothetical protein
MSVLGSLSAKSGDMPNAHTRQLKGVRSNNCAL